MTNFTRAALVLLAALLLLTPAAVLAQSLIVQVNLEEEGGQIPFREDEDEFATDEGDGADRGDNEACSILEISPDGTLTELVTNAQILALTGESQANCGDTGLAVAPDGTIYFSEDESHHLFRLPPGGSLEIFVDAEDIDALLGLSSDNDNGMDVGPDGTLFVADEDCDCIYTVSPDGQTLEIIVTEADIGNQTGNIDFDDRGPQKECVGTEPVADLEGGLVVASNGVVYFADDGAGCNPDRRFPEMERGSFGFINSLDSILSATPDGGGGYTVAVVTDEDDIFEALMSSYPDGVDTCTNAFAGLDLDIELGSDGFLYVLDDGVFAPPPEACRGDQLVVGGRLLRVDPANGTPTLVAEAEDFGALSGAPEPDFQANPEGGIAALGGALFVGDRTQVESPFRGGSETLNNIFRVSTSGDVSVHVSNQELQDFYGPLYSGMTARLSGGLDAGSADILAVPVSSRAGKLALVALIGLIGVLVARRKF